MEPTFDERAEWFDAHYSTTRGRVRLTLLLEQLAEILPAPPARVLDVGGGSGVVSVPMAVAGHEVTLLEPSEGMLRIAHRRIEAANVNVETVLGEVQDASSLLKGPFDAVCCHAVLMYVQDPSTCLRILRSLVESGAVLSLLEKNRDALVLRPAVKGDYQEALRVLDDPVAAGNLGIANRARRVTDWQSMLGECGWKLQSWAGVRMFSDFADDDLEAESFEDLLRLEREVGARQAYQPLARLIHMAAIAV